MAKINVDYHFYVNQYKGTAVPYGAFDRLSIEAEAFISKLTFGRIHKHSLRPDDLEAVKMAVCAVADVNYRADLHKGIKSENNDGYSVTYTDTNESAVRTKAIEAANLYLSETTLRNRCVNYDY